MCVCGGWGEGVCVGGGEGVCVCGGWGEGVCVWGGERVCVCGGVGRGCVCVCEWSSQMLLPAARHELATATLEQRSSRQLTR